MKYALRWSAYNVYVGSQGLGASLEDYAKTLDSAKLFNSVQELVTWLQLAVKSAVENKHTSNTPLYNSGLDIVRVVERESRSITRIAEEI